MHSRLNFSFASYTTVNARTNTASYNLIDPPALRRKFVLHQLFIRCNVFPIRSCVRTVPYRSRQNFPVVSFFRDALRGLSRFFFFAPTNTSRNLNLLYRITSLYRRIGFRFVKIIRLKIHFTSVLFCLTYFDFQRIDRLYGGKDASRKNNGDESERANLLIIRYAFLEIRRASARPTNIARRKRHENR